MRILVCEDEQIMLTTLEFRLRKHGYEVTIADDGEKAIQELERSLPDLIVADILMPKVNGLELIEYVRKKMKLDLPIIVISALDEEEVVLQAFAKGANDFITKPFRPNELILRIKRFTEKNLDSQQD